MAHYLGCKYCVPHEAGLASEARAVGRKLGKLLDSLGEINSFVIEQGELVDTCWRQRMDLIDKLRQDGWRITIPANSYKVLPPLPSKKGKK